MPQHKQHCKLTILQVKNYFFKNKCIMQYYIEYALISFGFYLILYYQCEFLLYFVIVLFGLLYKSAFHALLILMLMGIQAFTIKNQVSVSIQVHITFVYLQKC